MRTAIVIDKKELEKLYGGDIIGYSTVEANGSSKSLNGISKDKLEVHKLSTIGPYSVVSSLDVKGGPKLIVPNGLLEQQTVPDAIDLYKDILDRLHPNMWWYEKETTLLYILYPEIKITNSYHHEHTITDLLIRLYVSRNGSIGTLLQGTRLSWTEDEFYSRYAHSHLPKMYPGSFNDFCQGGGSQFQTLLRDMAKVNSPFEFEMLLLQLKEYLSWESVEGSPHISMTTIGTGTSSDTLADLSWRRLTYSDKLILDTSINRILEYIDKDNLQSTPICPLVRPTDSFLPVERKAVELLEGSIPQSVLSYDLSARLFVDTPDQGSSLSPGNYSFSNEIRMFIERVPGSYGLRNTNKKVGTQSNIIKRLIPIASDYIIDSINTRLTLATQELIYEQGEDIGIQAESSAND